MEASNGSSADRKSMTYGDTIVTHWKHPVAVSIKLEASGGSEYKICCCLPIAHHRLFPNSLQVLQFHSFHHRATSAI
jgi:hypothetical protein